MASKKMPTNYEIFLKAAGVLKLHSYWLQDLERR
jgi:hypothetical protein